MDPSLKLICKKITLKLAPRLHVFMGITVIEVESEKRKFNILPKVDIDK